MTSRAALMAAMCIAALGGCKSAPSKVDEYRAAAVSAEAGRRSAESEAYRRSAAERAAAEGPHQRAAATLELGTFLQRQQRYRESVAPLQQSLAAAREAGLPPEAQAVRQFWLARAFAPLNRWAEGAALLREAAPMADRLNAEDGRLASDVMDVYRVRLPQLGMDAGFLLER